MKWIYQRPAIEPLQHVIDAPLLSASLHFVSVINAHGMGSQKSRLVKEYGKCVFVIYLFWNDRYFHKCVPDSS